ncbi:MAG: metallophosphoesterase [Candidatus Micrarchaeota archaeon]
MRLLVFSDLHEEEQALEKLKAYAERLKPDYVLIGGDISRSVSFAEEALAAFSNAYFVPGNWDSAAVNDFYRTQKNFIHGKRLELAEGLNLVGFGYSCPTPFGTFGELSEQQIEEQAGKLKIDKNTILLLHCPPKGYFDLARSVPSGSESLLKLVNKKKPRLCLFAHIHENIGTTEQHGTVFIKVPAAKDNMCVFVEVSNKSTYVEFIYL